MPLPIGITHAPPIGRTLNTIGVVNEYLPTPGVHPLEECRKAFESCLDAEQLQRYRLPASNQTRVIIGLSGGADSTVLALFAALYLAPIIPPSNSSLPIPKPSRNPAIKRWINSNP